MQIKINVLSCLLVDKLIVLNNVLFWNVIKGDTIWINFSMLSAFKVVTPTKSYTCNYKKWNWEI